MQELARQLEAVRRRSRRLLLFQRLAEAAVGAVGVLVGLGLVDYGLRLPGWLRALVAAGLLGWGVWWVGRKLRAAWRFWPSLDELALRVEALEPALSGRLASALDFGTRPQEYDAPRATARTAALAARSVAATRGDLARAAARRLVRYGPSGRRGLGLLAAAGLLAALALAAPVSSGIAAARWLMPWSDAAWPRRTAVQVYVLPSSDQPAAAGNTRSTLTNDPDATENPGDASDVAVQTQRGTAAGVRAADGVIEFAARVTRGYRPGMRVWLHLRELPPGESLPDHHQNPATATTDGHAVPNNANGDPAPPTDGEPAGPAPQDAADWSFLMTEQEAAALADGSAPADGVGRFRLQWRPGPDLIRRVERAAATATGPTGSTNDDPTDPTDPPAATGHRDTLRLAFWVQAGDDTTPAQPLGLTARPALRSATLRLEPPTYAVSRVGPRDIELDPTGGPTASLSALAGSAVRWELSFNKPLPATALEPAALLPGLADAPGLTAQRLDDRRVAVSYRLDQTRRTTVALTDRHGLQNLDPRVYRLEATPDRPPTVGLIQPRADASVLATAVLPVRARAGDDVAVESLTLWAQHPIHGPPDASPDTPENPVSPETPAPPDSTTTADPSATTTAPQTSAARVTLATATGRQATLEADATLDLATLPLRVGDTVQVHATARDGFSLDGQTHPPTDATPRLLRIVDQATLIAQVRGELAGVRQQAVRLERRQDQLNRRAADLPSARAAEQNRISRSLDNQTQQLDRLRQRLTLNRLAEPALDELIRSADQLLRNASASSAAAEAGLQQATPPPTPPADPNRPDPPAPDPLDPDTAARQEEVRQRLEDLARLLDQGQDALGLRLELTRLKTEQEALARDTRELLPRTIGRRLEDLPEDARQALQDLADRQDALRQQARDAVANLQNTAEALARRDPASQNADADRAAAQALAEAAELAQRRGLDQQLQQAAQGLDDNQLSQAGAAQNQSLDTLEQMMQQLGEQDQLRQELLRRRLLALAERLRRLIESQTQANASWAPLNDAGLLEAAAPQAALWTLTIAAQTEAEADENTAPVGPIIGQAVDAQAAAIQALRAADRPGAAAGGQVARERLEAALAKVQELQAQEQQDENAQQRAQLRQQYQELAQRQADLRQRTADLIHPAPDPGVAPAPGIDPGQDAGNGPDPAAPAALTRRDRATLRGLGQEQAQVQTDAAELGQTVDQTVVFQKVHELIDAAAADAAGPMSRGEDDGLVLLRQQKVVTLLESMADALDDAGRPAEFASQPAGGDAGGGGQGGPPPLVPPAAELKLLRGVQQAVYDETRALDEAGPAVTADQRAARLRQLAREQREVSQTGQRLLESLSPPTPAGPPAPDDPAPDDDTPPPTPRP